jgi:hypothetical protein
MNPSAPQIHGTIKLHKPGKPIRCIVNWTDSPGYKLAKYLNTFLNVFNVENSNALAHTLKQLEINENTRLCLFDIENMYTNIPIHEVRNIVNDIINKNHYIAQATKNEIKNLLNVITEQNYIEHNGKWYKQNDGLAMGAPTSAILAEVFIQCLEHTDIVNVLQKSHIVDYHRYVDDILIIYNTHTTNINDILNKFNNIHPKIKFTIEKEENDKINFLDLSISRIGNRIELAIYRKPTTTDLIIPNDSCHPSEHKKNAINYLLNRINQYPITSKNKKEESIINVILNNNNYPTNIKQKCKENKSKQQKKKSRRRKKKRNGLPSPFLDPKPEPSRKYLKIPILLYHTVLKTT